MKQIAALNNIDPSGLEFLRLAGYRVGADIDSSQAILLRSKDLHSVSFGDNILAIARAGIGVNNIPVAECSLRGIPVFNTPAANANSVKELVIAGLLLSSRAIYEGIHWVDTLDQELDSDTIKQETERCKSQFAGPEIAGKTLGVIGLGSIGVMVANVAVNLGMRVIGYDPFISVDSAWRLSRAVERSNEINKMMRIADYLTLHIPYNKKTEKLISSKMLQSAKIGMRILNFSRPEIADQKALMQAIDTGSISRYVTDFPDKAWLGNDKVLCIPHLGASTPEAERNCALMAARQLRDYLETGNISNSVNFPECAIERPAECAGRLAVVNKNVPTMIGKIAAILAQENINIHDLTNRHRDNIAYNIIDADKKFDPPLLERLRNIDGVIRARAIN